MTDAQHPSLTPAGSPDTDERDTLLALHALGAASPTEARAAIRAAADDPTAAKLAADWAAIAAFLPDACADFDETDEAPSPALKGRVLALVRAEMHGAPPDGSTAVRLAPPPVSITTARRSRVSTLAGWVVAAVLLLAVVGLGAANVRLRGDVAQAQHSVQAVQYAATGIHAYTMAGTASAPRANATLVESPADGGRVVLMAKGFPVAAAGQTYRVWLRWTDGSYRAVGTFDSDNEEATSLVISGSLTGVREVVITAEPAGKSGTAPSGTPVMQGEL